MIPGFLRSLWETVLQIERCKSYQGTLYLDKGHGCCVCCRSGQCFVQATTSAGPAVDAGQDVGQGNGFKKPFRMVQQDAPQKARQSLFDPTADDALYFNRGRDHEIPVVMDPYLCKYGCLWNIEPLLIDFRSALSGLIKHAVSSHGIAVILRRWAKK